MRERLLRVQSERLELPAPLGRRIAKTLHANAAGQATLNRGSDEIRREERERDGHVNLANAAFFAGGDLFVLRRQHPGRIRLFSTDRLLWVWLYGIWPRCLDAMVLVKPATVRWRLCPIRSRRAPRSKAR